MKGARVPQLSFNQGLICGFIAGGITRTALAPFETVKTLQQIGSDQIGGDLHGLVTSSTNLYKTEGALGFFKGNLVNIFKTLPFNIAQNWSANLVISLLRDPETKSIPPFANLLAGIFSNIAAAAVTLPQEVVKTRLTQQRLSSPKYIGVIDAFTSIVKEEGWGALFKGWLPTIIGPLPNSLAVEFFSPFFSPRRDEPPGLLEGILNATIITVVAQFASFPFDTARKQMMAQSAINNLPANMIAPIRRSSSLKKCFTQIIDHNGVPGLWAGLLSNVVRAFPNLVIMYFSQEFCKNIFLWLNGYTVHPFVPIQRKDIPRGIDYLTLRQWLHENPQVPKRVWLSKSRIAEEYDYNVWF
jgi:solute carrier family 25 phosphate transporter 23/24/25/41